MTRARSPDREKARLMWLRSGKTLKLKEIAEIKAGKSEKQQCQDIAYYSAYQYAGV